jgi:glycine betaine/proline transport system substrate-binding protein
MRRSCLKFVALLTIIVLVLAACGDDDEPKKESSKPVIKLAEAPWLSDQVTVAVARILLEDQLGYQVEVVPTDPAQQWEAVSSGTVHARMEIWPMSSEAEFQQYVTDAKTVEDGGALGPAGHGGWYVPTYVIDDHPDLQTWEGLKNPDNIALFATQETGGKGRLLSGDPAWVHSQAAETLVQNLELDLQIVYAGTEQDELDVLAQAYEKREPILIYFWTPHWAHALYDLFEVQLPPYSDECYADQAAIDCAYPSDPFHKVFWPGLAEYAPEAYQFLKNFNYTTMDQIQIMALVEIDKKTVDEAARTWIEKNEAIWKPWVPE